jgi:HEAT repeat protein
MLHCEPDEPSIIEPYTASEDRRVRAAAIAALAKHGGADAVGWYERGLKDPEACVRLETARVLRYLDAKVHRRIFDLARYDPNPEIAKLARKLTAHKAYPPLMGGRERVRR